MFRTAHRRPTNHLDNNHYYLARYNPLEKNLRLYTVVNGKRTTRVDAAVDVPSGEWFTMRISMKGDQITCSVNGKKLVESRDPTFESAGRVGFWSKADAQSFFDDFTIKTR